MRQFKKLIVFSLVLILTVSSVISSYSIPVRADTRTVEDQRQSILNRCVELENQYTTKAISEYTLLFHSESFRMVPLIRAKSYYTISFP